MTPPNKRLKQVALLISIGIHIGILSLSFAPPKTTITPNPHLQIPVQLSITETPPPPKKIIKKTRPKRTSLPGDRKRPKVVHSASPIYPKDALNLELTGKVIVDFIINARGKILSHKIVKSSGHPILDNSFIRTVKTHYRFKPKRVMGKNKTSKIRLDSGDAYEF